jgi:hypothetical protein
VDGAPRILIAGGYGVFGSLLARELLDTTPARLMIAGRDPSRAEVTCRALGAPGRVTPLALDLTDLASVAHAAEGCIAVACTAGPFQSLDAALPAAVVDAGAHWLDIADHHGWVLPLLANQRLHAHASDAAVAVLTGQSTVPALSGALTRWCLSRLPDATRVRTTLFIGNRNHKGAGAITSALTAGFSEPRTVTMPVGRRRAYLFDSPDPALLRDELGLRAEFRVTFEWQSVNLLMSLLAPLARRAPEDRRAAIARALAMVAMPFSRIGSHLGCLQVEARGESGAVRAYVTAPGQLLAILPCAFAVQSLLAGDLTARGVLRPPAWMAPNEWLTRLRGRGVGFGCEARGDAATASGT